MICFSNEKEAAIAIKERNIYKRWTAEEYPDNSKNEYHFKECQKHKSHE